MDNRQTFKIQQLVDCEKQEPFYPATIAEAVSIIDNGQLKNLQDIIGSILYFIQNFGNLQLSDLLQLGYTHDTAYPGDEGLQLSQKMEEIYPTQQIVITDSESSNYLKPVSSAAIIAYLDNFKPEGEIEEDDDRAVSGDTIYKYIYNNIYGGIIAENNDKYVTGGDIWNYLQDYTPNGEIDPNEDKAVSGSTVYNALNDIQENLVWEAGKDNENTPKEGSIKQKSFGEQNLNLEITKENEIAIGKYNQSNEDTIFSIGNGTNNGRINAVEITNDLNNSLKIPYQGVPVSIQTHMDNGQPNIKHISQYQYEKLDQLIQKTWYAKYTVSFDTRTNIYYDNNRGLNFGWNITDSEGGTSGLTNISVNIKQGSRVIFNSTTASGTKSITTYAENAQTGVVNYPVFNISQDGRTSFTFIFNLYTSELDSKTEELTKYIYAPPLYFISTNNNITSIPSGATKIRVTSFNNFNTTVAIPNNNGAQYIYLAIPRFMNISRPTADYQPFKDGDSGIEFNLANDYFQSTTLQYTLPENLIVNVNYDIVRSAQPLNAGSSWKIVRKTN